MRRGDHQATDGIGCQPGGYPVEHPQARLALPRGVFAEDHPKPFTRDSRRANASPVRNVAQAAEVAVHYCSIGGVAVVPVEREPDHSAREGRSELSGILLGEGCLTDSGQSGHDSHTDWRAVLSERETPSMQRGVQAPQVGVSSQEILGNDRPRWPPPDRFRQRSRRAQRAGCCSRQSRDIRSEALALLSGGWARLEPQVPQLHRFYVIFSMLWVDHQYPAVYPAGPLRRQKRCGKFSLASRASRVCA